MKKFLIALFIGVLAAMLYVTITASLNESVLTAGARLWSDAWFRATLADTYFAFLTFYLWVAYKESCWMHRVLWLLAILALGNIAIAAYMLRELWRLPKKAPISDILLRSER